MAYHEQLAQRVRDFFKAAGSPVEQKRMMGGLCFMVNGKMCVGVEKDRLMARIDPEGYEAALKRKGCTPMDFTGRPMRGYVYVHLNGLKTAADLKSWLDLALQFNPKAKASKSRQSAAAKKPTPAIHLAKPALKFNRPQSGSSVVLLLCLSALLMSCAVRASDWPHLLGPTRDAVYTGPPLADKWPTEGPRIVWKLDVGEGYSSPVVAEGRLIQCHRLDDLLHVECLDPATGKRHWTFKHEMKFKDGAYFDHGPRPTPAIREGKVYVHNTDGYLACLDLKSGEKLWSRNPKAEFKSSATWHGCAASPLLTDRALILPVGGTNDAGIVAFALSDGKLLWQVTGEKASASTPVLKHLNGKEQLIVVTREALHGIDPATGQDYWRYPTRKQSSGNLYASTPVVFGDQIFLTGWYQLGGLLLQVTNQTPRLLWHLDDAISSHYTCIIVRDGFAYGFHGHAWEKGGPNLRCIELATGKVLWEEPKLGSGTIIRADDQFVILADTGELLLATATPQKFTIKHRVQIVGRPTRSYPALADGFAYVKGPKQLVCVDLRADTRP